MIWTPQRFFDFMEKYEKEKCYSMSCFSVSHFWHHVGCKKIYTTISPHNSLKVLKLKNCTSVVYAAQYSYTPASCHVGRLNLSTALPRELCHLWTASSQISHPKRLGTLWTIDRSLIIKAILIQVIKKIHKKKKKEKHMMLAMSCIWWYKLFF